MQDEIYVEYSEPIGNAIMGLLTKGNKKIIFPNIIVEIKSQEDIDTLLYNHRVTPENTIYIFSLPFYEDLENRAIYLNNLPMRERPKITLKDIFSKNIIIGDPCPEAFWLKRPNIREKFSHVYGLPKAFFNTFDKYTPQNYSPWEEAGFAGDYANLIDALLRYEYEKDFDFFVPLVPTIDVGTLHSTILSYNHNMAVIRRKEESKIDMPVLYNLTLNSNVFYRYNNELIESIKSFVTEALQSRNFFGVYVRIRGIDKLIQRKDYEQILPRLHDFILWLGSISISFKLPVFLIHSGYYGYYALEQGIQAFSEPTTGDLGDIKDIKKWNRNSKPPKKEKLYGNTLIIDDCLELNIKELMNYISENGRLPHLDHVPDKPTDEQIRNTRNFRVYFSKPRRIATRKEEVKRFNHSLNNNEVASIEHYFLNSKNKILKRFIGMDE